MPPTSQPHADALNICIVSLSSLPLHVETGGRSWGGAEAQTALLAQALHQRGHRVSVVLTDYEEGGSQPRLTPFPLYNAYRTHSGVPGLRFFSPRWSGFYRAMAKADADVYLQMCAGAATGQVAHFCRRNRRGFVFAAASDSDVDPRRLRLGFRDRHLYRWGLRRAHRVVAQHRGQSEALQQNYGIAANAVPMATPIPEGVHPPGEHPVVLWLGTVRSVKQPQRLVALARRCPETVFSMVGGPSPGEPEVYGELCAMAEAVPNLQVHGLVPELAAVWDNVGLLVNTSDIEGFPTTFLEAWARGVPTLSYFDPGGVIAERGLGWVVSSESEMAERLQQLLQAPAQLVSTGAAGREHVLREHAPGVVAERFEREFRLALEARG